MATSTSSSHGQGVRSNGRLAAAGILFVLGALLCLAIVIAAALGPYALAPQEVLATLAARLMGQPAVGAADTVLFQIRLPRIIAGALVGAALAAAGAAYQS